MGLTDSTAFLVTAVLLVLAAGVFAASEAAIAVASRARVDELVREGRGGAKQFALLLADRPRHVNLLLLLRLACELGATVLVTVVALRLADSEAWAVVIAGLIMLVASYVLVGVGPRTLGRQHPYGIGLKVAAPVRVLARLLNPLTRLLILIGNMITPGKGFREGPFSTEVELRELVDLAGERGVVAAGEREMIHSVFELGDTLAREVMVPRTEIIWIEQTKSARQALALCLRSGFSRVPVIGESVDDIVGVVTVKDLTRTVLTARDEAGPPVSELMRPASFVPDTKRVDELLREMQLSRSHLAIAVDEYGGTAGLLTIEDIIEEIVGEITDESDLEEHRPVEKLDDGTVRVSSRLPVEDLGELFGVELDDSDVETVGGLLAQRLGRVPLPGAETEIAGLKLRAEGGKDHRGRIRINALLVRPANTDQAPLRGADQEGSNTRG
ncbi:Hemolysin, contains CBS domains [Saccharopolyspora antimicrobica]|uniref:CBS domain containing-hemolysin-like protein n=2 Tax=Saccharopolyspora TaxID=1835 RepID=A0A1I4YQ30_9PSEU|nr:CBS domain containing-hemolysin-like protein [Saccharopolyspora antimicrobica]SEG93009.1 Hemolysin, contains CBS domains [Saccharopolyspora kobensis]SFD42025.1 Hemolysin, contains CBS domains [Saccharopolyspora kobensis]SFN40067.1 Hemolysin, contains CBS domains [Saccharopolyspora antimicrobica]